MCLERSRRGGHYGIGLEWWGAGEHRDLKPFSGRNGPPLALPEAGVSGWQICLGGTFTHGTVINNISREGGKPDVWNGYGNAMGKALTYEESATKSNAG